MTLDDAKKVLFILASAGGKDPVAARPLFDQFVKHWPDHGLSVIYVWKRIFDKTWPEK